MRVILSVMLFAASVGGVDGQALPQETLQVTLLGTGAPPPDRDRMGPSILVEAGELKLLFDVGRGATSSIRAHGLNLGAIQTVFLTHLHVDHLVGLADFWLTGHHRDRFGQRTEPVVVYGPVGAGQMVAGLLDAYGGIARGWGLPDVALHLSAVEIRGPGVIYDEDGVRVTAFPVPHDEVSYGFKIEHRGRSAVISGDTGFSEEVIRQAQGVDVLIHEVFYVAPDGGMAPDLLARLSTIHTVPEAAARVFSAARPRMAVATHLGGPHVPRLEAEVRAGYDGRFVVGEDLMTLVVADSIQVVRR